MSNDIRARRERLEAQIAVKEQDLDWFRGRRFYEHEVKAIERDLRRLRAELYFLA